MNSDYFDGKPTGYPVLKFDTTAPVTWGPDGMAP